MVDEQEKIDKVKSLFEIVDNCQLLPTAEGHVMLRPNRLLAFHAGKDFGHATGDTTSINV